MGTIQHHVVIATYSDYDNPVEREDLVRALKEALVDDDPMAIDVEKMLVGPIHAPANGYISYILTTDGSKMGWMTHCEGNDIRNIFYDYMVDNVRHPEVVEVSYGEIGVMIERSTYDY